MTFNVKNHKAYIGDYLKHFGIFQTSHEVYLEIDNYHFQNCLWIPKWKKLKSSNILINPSEDRIFFKNLTTNCKSKDIMDQGLIFQEWKNCLEDSYLGQRKPKRSQRTFL